MCDQHEKKIVKETDIVERRQSAPSPDHEKGASDQNFQVSQVGQLLNDRKRAAAPCEAAQRSFWYDDPVKEIGVKPGSTGTVGGWVYVRTKTGHLKKRFDNRGSVSEIHSSEARPLSKARRGKSF